MICCWNRFVLLRYCVVVYLLCFGSVRDARFIIVGFLMSF